MAPESTAHSRGDGKRVADHMEYVFNQDGNLSYAVDKDGSPVTVLDTMGQDPNQAQTISFKAYVIIALIALGQFTNAYLGVSPAVAAYTVAADLKAPSMQSWIVQAQGIPSIVSGPIIAVISDVYGRKFAMIGLLLCAIAACIICMVTTNINVLIFGQTLNGVSAGIIGLLFAIPSEVVPARYRSIVQGINTSMGFFGVFVALMSTGAAMAADPVNGWRWVWRTQLICNGIILIGIAVVYRPPPRTAQQAESFGSRIRQLDWIGYLLLTGGLVPLLMGFAWASDPQFGWSDPHSYACIACGFASFVACVIWEWKGTSTGFLHHALFKQGRNFPLAVLLCAVEGDIFYLINNIYTNEAFGIWFPTISSLEQSATLLPFYGMILITTPFIMYYTTRTKDLKNPLIVGFALCLVGLIGMGTTTDTSTTRALVFNGIMGPGFAALLMLLVTVIQFASPPLFIGVASALAISCRTLGGTIGYGVALVIHSSVYENKLSSFVWNAVSPLGFNVTDLDALIGALASGNATVIAAVPGASPAVIAAASAADSEAAAYSYSRVWYAAIPAVVLGLVAMFFIKNPGGQMDWVIDAPLDTLHREIDKEASALAGKADDSSAHDNENQGRGTVLV
ncbi:hypothetical protein JCM24511_04957 [Saitozyma sp. JCM 24511]|nr:hypothetical protein JCM24511_04957 [Saitozyma sp. JCM 24511]